MINFKKGSESSSHNEYGLLPPAKLSPEEENICRKLDAFYNFYKLGKKPSDYYRGAIFAAKEETKSNPDWLAQAAHSFREILYPFFSSNVKEIKERKKSAFTKYGAVGLITEREIGIFWGKINNVAHHREETNFDYLRQEFVSIMNKALAFQVDIHKMIDQILGNKPKSNNEQQKVKEISDLISLNPDTRQYFYNKADERWLEWLWGNNFLDVIKQKAKDPTRYGFQMPELAYLVRMAKIIPKQVTDIMLVVLISKDTFNPEVIDRFLYICSILPAEQLARIVTKIRDEGWVRLMGVYNHLDFVFEDMLKILSAAKDYNSILMLAQTILSVRTQEEINRTSRGAFTDNPFYFEDLISTNVFDHLSSIDDDHAEQALELVAKIMSEVVSMGGEADSNSIFLVKDIFYLYDIDFFSLQPGDKKGIHYRENVRELAAVIKILIERLIGKRCDDAAHVRNIYEKHINPLPDSMLTWRFRLFVLSMCPEVYKDELKKAFLRLFETMDAGKSCYQILAGTEYEKALKKCFGSLDGGYQQEYVRKIFDRFGRNTENIEKEQDYKRYGLRLLSCICGYLTKEDQKKCEEVFGKKCDAGYEPKPFISQMKGGFVSPKGPISQEEFGKLAIADIAKKLRAEWTPEALQKRNIDDDFLNPLNAEGAGKLLRVDITRRLQGYVENAGLFFERDVLAQHYTYSFMQGIQEVIRANKNEASSIDWSGLLELCITIKKSAEGKAFDRELRGRDTFDAWLSGWTGVHSAMADVIRELVKDNGKCVIDSLKYRDQLLAIISYLLGYPDPVQEDEESKTATMTIKSAGTEEYLVSDPFTMAINSVRGRAFEAFVLFIYQDGKQFSKEDKIKVSPDVKGLYELVLRNETTRAIMFLFGHYLPSFYFRDKEWIHGLLPQIFPLASEKKHLYLAAWEGYLVNNLYEEIFFDPEFQKLYERGLALTGKEDPERKYFQKPDEGIATHFALAYMYYEGFVFGHSLFDGFWKNKNPEQHASLISFLGRMFISGSNERADELLKKEPRCKERLKVLWDWMLDNYKDTRPFDEFGYWISLEKDIYEVKWLAERVRKTLKITNGTLNWDLGLDTTIAALAKDSPEDTLEIARLYILESMIRKSHNRIWYRIKDEWLEAFETLYNNASTKEATAALINDLIREGGSIFWKLKEIIK